MLIPMSKVEYQFLRVSEGREYYLTDIEALISDDNQGKPDIVYEVCPVCKHKHDLGIDGYYIDHHYNKRKLGVMPSHTVAHCNRCNAVFLDSTDECRVRIPKLKFNLNTVLTEVSIIKLDETQEVIDHARPLNDAERYVLNARNPKIDPDKYGMMYSSYYNRPAIMVPFYLMGKPIYYQRRFLDREGPKYHNPSIKGKPIYIPKGCDFHSKVVICEGVYDAIACVDLFPGYMPVAILGKDITPYHIDLIRKLITPDDIIVRMDEDKLSQKIADTINKSPLSYLCGEAEIVHVELKDGDDHGYDPEEELRESLGLPRHIEIEDLYENYHPG